MNETKIEWTDCSWNPIRARHSLTNKLGHFCQKVSPGCAHCYASRMQKRFGTPEFPGTGKSADDLGLRVYLDEAKLLEPLKRRKPAKVFVCDMSDLFGEWVPDEWIDRIFAVMALCPNHTFQILTKRAERMANYLADCDHLGVGMSDRISNGIAQSANVPPKDIRRRWPLPNVWLGVSVEDQKRADERIPHLLRCPAAVRFLSCEPLLGPIRLSGLPGLPTDDEDVRLSPLEGRYRMSPRDEDGHPMERIHWVIVGGESGPGARPCNVEWVRSIVSQCKAAGVACFVKQLGRTVLVDGPDKHLFPTFDDVNGNRYLRLEDSKGGNPDEWPEDLRVREFPEVAIA